MAFSMKGIKYEKSLNCHEIDHYFEFFNNNLPVQPKIFQELQLFATYLQCRDLQWPHSQPKVHPGDLDKGRRLADHVWWPFISVLK